MKDLFLCPGQTNLEGEKQEQRMFKDLTAQPPTVACKMEAQSEQVHVACTFLHVFDTDWYAQSVLSDKIYALELRRKFIKSVLLVGKMLHFRKHFFLLKNKLSFKKKKKKKSLHSMTCGQVKREKKNTAFSPLFLPSC